MEIKEEHKALLMQLGLKEKDLALFDGEFVSYEYDIKRGVRLYDPYYATSYNEYIGIDGWSAWSSEGDTFMSDILARSGESRKSEKASSRSEKQEMKNTEEALKKKFGKV